LKGVQKLIQEKGKSLEEKGSEEGHSAKVIDWGGGKVRERHPVRIFPTITMKRGGDFAKDMLNGKRRKIKKGRKEPVMKNAPPGNFKKKNGTGLQKATA